MFTFKMNSYSVDCSEFMPISSSVSFWIPKLLEDNDETVNDDELSA